MLKFIKRAFPVILVAAALVFAAGCSGETATSDGKTVLNISCWIYDNELDDLIERFRKEHPDVEIVEKHYCDDDTDFETATSRMNAELMTDEDVDLYYLENAMDVKALVNASLLMDLYPLMEADESFQRDAYFENVWSAMEVDGALYEMPVGFQLGAIAGPQTLLGDRSGWTIEEYEAFAVQQEEPETVLPTSREQMLFRMTSYALFDYIDLEVETCSFDSKSFGSWLEFVASFPEYPDAAAVADAKLQDRWIMGVRDYTQLRDEFGDRVQLVGFPCDGAYAPCIETLLTYGISARTDQKELCWEFIKMMLSEDFQKDVISPYNFPMKKSVFETQLADAMLPVTDERTMVSEESLLGPLSEEETEYLRNLVYGLSQIRLRYAEIAEIVEEEAESVFSGDRSAGQMAEVIQNRVQIYLNEHSWKH